MPEEDLQYIGRTIKEVVPRDNTVIYRGRGPQLFVRTYHTADSVIVPTIALQALQEQARHKRSIRPIGNIGHSSSGPE